MRPAFGTTGIVGIGFSLVEKSSYLLVFLPLIRLGPGAILIFKPMREGENVARPCANCDRKETELVSLFLTSVDLIGPLVVSSRTGECFMKILAGCGLLRTRWLATR